MPTQSNTEEDKDVLEEEVTNEETTEEVKEEEPSESLEDLREAVKELRLQLARVTKESVKRKKKIRELESTKTSSDGQSDADLLAQIDTLKTENASLKRSTRSNKIADIVSDVITTQKVKLASSKALKDLARFIEEGLPDDAEEAELKEEIASMIPGAIKERPYLVEQKRAPVPDLDQHKRGESKDIPSDLIDEVARDFGLSNP